MTDNEFVDKYQNALSDLCGVDYAYMQGDSAVDTIVELIRLAVEQKAEIERLADYNKQLRYDVKKIQTEAIKEFAERLKERANEKAKTFPYDRSVNKGDIDNIVKEMEGDKC